MFFLKLFNHFFSSVANSPHLLRYLYYKKKYSLPKSFVFNGQGILFHGKGDIVIGDNSYIGRSSYLQASNGKKISIGDYVSISHIVYIYTKSNFADQDFSKKKSQDFKTVEGDVTISDYCWIGAKVFINPGVIIGENTVVGSNSVVTRSLPPDCIAVGAPAKVVKFKNYISEEKKNEIKKKYQLVLSDKLKD